MSDSDRAHYRENTQDYFSVSEKDSELTASEASHASPQRRADTSLEEVLGGSGPENLFFDNLRLDPAQTRFQAELARQRARENARRRLIVPEERAEDDAHANEPLYANAFMADRDRGEISRSRRNLLASM